jgi:hypothetical protein
MISSMLATDLTTNERSQLLESLLSAYPDYSEVDMLLYYGDGLEATIAQIAPPGPIGAVLTAVIRWAEAEGKTEALVEAAFRRKPGNRRLKAFHAAYLSTAQRDVTPDALERLTSSSVRFQDPARWRDRMARVEACVCRVLRAHRPVGSGFLVAPGLVMTNQHVIEGFEPSDMVVEFGRHLNASGALGESRCYPVEGPPLAEGPPHPIDSQADKPPAPPPDDHSLDFAILRVGGGPESEVLNGQPRGFLAKPSEDTKQLLPGSLLCILQHPTGRPLKFAFDVVLRVNENRTRVSYRVNTEPGSSGSPCFDADWNLVAIHHSGDPSISISPANYNEGIPIQTIRASLPAAVLEQLRWT